MRSGFEVVSAVFLHLGLETRGAAPIDVLTAIVGEHLLRRLILARCNTEDFQHIIGSVAAKQIASYNEARVIIHEGYDVGIATTQAEGEDIGLPHLVGSSSFEEAGPDQVATRLGWWLDESLLMECLADRLGTGWQEEHPPEELGYLLDATGWLLFFQLEDFVADGLGQLRARPSAKVGLQSLLALEPITCHPFIYSGTADTEFLGDHLLGEAFFQVELDRAQSFLKSSRRIFSPSPPRGGGVLLLLCYRFILLHVDTFYH